MDGFSKAFYLCVLMPRTGGIFMLASQILFFLILIGAENQEIALIIIMFMNGKYRVGG
jgi:hypothetical protein